MQSVCHGIVIKKTRYKDYDLIIHFYTQELGLIGVYARGVYKKKSKNKLQHFQPLSILQLEIVKGKTDLFWLKSSKPLHNLFEIHTDIVKMNLSVFFAEILSKSIKHNEEDASLYHFIEQKVLELNQCSENLGNFHLYFLYQLSKELGIQPNTNYSQNNYFDLREACFVDNKPFHTDYLEKNESLLLSEVLGTIFAGKSPIIQNKKLRMTMLNKCLTYFRIHLSWNSEPKSFSVLKDIFAE